MEENKKVEVKVEAKENLVQKVGKGISKLGDKISAFEQKHEVGIKRFKRGALLGGAAILGGIVIHDHKAKKLGKEVDALEWHELPDPEDEELEQIETETSEDMEEPAEE